MGLEPTRLESLDPKSSVFTNFTIELFIYKGFQVLYTG